MWTFSHVYDRGSAALLLACVVGMASACDRLPMTAPTGSIVTLAAGSTETTVEGEVEIVALVNRGVLAGGNTAGTVDGLAGPPVNNGTVVLFTTTLGRLDPIEGTTRDGRVTVRLFAGSLAGTATIKAYSGGAQSEDLSITISASPDADAP
jgi:hypothetical protein